jgi:type II secretory pathway component GspD/PulD (secretin)
VRICQSLRLVLVILFALACLPAAAQTDEELAEAAGFLPGEIGTRDALAQKLPEINVDGVGLAEVIDFFRDVSGLNVYVDWAGVQAAGVRRDAPVKVAAKDILLHKALGRVLDSAAGGKGKLKADAVGAFVVVSTPKRLEATRARFRRLKDKTAEEKLAGQLRRPLPEVNFDGTALRDVVDFIRDVSGADIVVEWTALEKAKIGPDAPVTLRMKNVPLDQVLRLILDSAAGDKAVPDFEVKGNVITVSVAPGTA